eukprot:TRINITY_DN5014_c0_g1_i1.p1 TRINITY_DN5014_c0_g1~~TRINITY_DN5014_c0_g1_i1.p1  ORF type:complete len:187 (-),score=53.71 TRINITY_DN5014_c0_g1_i1:655-1215(-)
MRNLQDDEEDLFSFESGSKMNEDDLFGDSSSGLFGSTSSKPSTKLAQNTSLFETVENDDNPSNFKVDDLFIPKTAQTQNPAVFREAKPAAEIAESNDDLSFLEEEVDLKSMSKPTRPPVEKKNTATPTIGKQHVASKPTVETVDDDLFSFTSTASTSSTNAGLNLTSIDAYIAAQDDEEEKGLFDF